MFTMEHPSHGFRGELVPRRPAASRVDVMPAVLDRGRRLGLRHPIWFYRARSCRSQSGLLDRYPGVEIAGTYAPILEQEDAEETLAAIRAAGRCLGSSRAQETGALGKTPRPLGYPIPRHPCRRGLRLQRASEITRRNGCNGRAWSGYTDWPLNHGVLAGATSAPYSLPCPRGGNALSDPAFGDHGPDADSNT